MTTTTATQDETTSVPIVIRLRTRYTGPPPYPEDSEASALRRTPAVLIDVVLHLVPGLIAATAVGDVAWYFPALVAGYLVASFTHRVLLQRWWGATFGKVVCNLAVVESGTGRTPTLWRLTQWWLVGLAYTIFAVFTS